MTVHNDVDAAGTVTFFSGHGPAEPLGPCPHDCDHRHRAVVAWGPDWDRYELLRCDDQCGGRCRGWKRVDSYSDHGTVDRWTLVGDERPLHDDDRTIPVGKTYAS